MLSLPIDEAVPSLVAAVVRAGALVLIAPPGAGKTTRLPPALSISGHLNGKKLILLQPRRIAAQAAAKRIAWDQRWTLGEEVGFEVRFERKASPRTPLLVMTEGVLLRKLQADPFLEEVGAVVFDEFHERSLTADLLLALLQEIREDSRPDLKIVVMSATMDPEPVRRFLNRCPVEVIEGQNHPIEVTHLPPRSGESTEAAVERAIVGNLREDGGNTLVFLPGMGVIHRTYARLLSFTQTRGFELHRLHGSLPLDEQRRVLLPSPRRKIILSTNVAETSLTIEGVDLVIDSGLVRLLKHDARHGIDRLETVRASRESTRQRTGRAGRTGPGWAVRLWGPAQEARLDESTTPEIHRVDLSGAVLELTAWGVKRTGSYRWFDPPNADALARAERLLVDLGAIDRSSGSLTETGRFMCAIPCHPRLARIVLAAAEVGLLEEGALIAALLEERDILRPSQGSSQANDGADPSDLFKRLELFEEARRREFSSQRLESLGVEPARAKDVDRSRRSIVRSARAERNRIGGSRDRRSVDLPSTEAKLARALMQGYPDRVARRREKTSPRARMVGGHGVFLTRTIGEIHDSDLFLALVLDENIRRRHREARVRLACPISRQWLEEGFPDAIRESVNTWFDRESGKVRSTVTTTYVDLPLETPRERNPDAKSAERILAQAVRENTLEIIQRDKDLVEWLKRVDCLRTWLPEASLPSTDESALGEVLASHCVGKKSLAELQAVGFKALVQSSLDYAQRELVETEAPKTLLVPSGSRIRLRYDVGKPPVLAVRLQELFGLPETPRVARGRVPVVLELLGPNQRPVQVTQDLRSFWETTYVQVRKDLRARYPKHSWPEDPWNAAPVRGTARRKKREGS